MVSLQRMVGEMHGSLQQLQTDNLALQHQNQRLEAQNKELMETLNEQECVKSWSRFDVVEEHYKQIARHKAQRREAAPQGEGDSAAGVSRSCSASEQKDAKADLDITISAANTEDVQNISALIVSAVSARGWKRDEIMGIKPDGFSDSSGASIEATNPQELVQCKHWPLALRFAVSVRRADSALRVEQEPQPPGATPASHDENRRKTTGSTKSRRPPLTYSLDQEVIPVGSTVRRDG
jgi:hypothetical protein